MGVRGICVGSFPSTFRHDAVDRQRRRGAAARPSFDVRQSDTYSGSNSPGIVAAARNADGSVNSAANPAPLGSMVSVYLNGLAPNPQITTAPPQFYTNDGWTVLSMALVNPFVLGVNLQVPSTLENNFSCSLPSVCAARFTLFDVSVDSVAGFPGVASLGAIGGFVYLKR
jgi:hypothetical protein